MMTESKHTPGRWRSSGEAIYSGDILIGALFSNDLASEQDEANAARAVACVNACQGIEDPEREVPEMREALALVRLGALRRHPQARGEGGTR